MGFSPTLAYLPAYPAPRLAVNAFWQSAPDTQLSIGHYADESDSFSHAFTIARHLALKPDL